MNGLLPIVINLISGAVGGNVAGALLKKLSFGVFGNSILGILGGGLGSQLLGVINVSAGSGAMNPSNIIGQILAGGVGGGALMAIIGLLRTVFNK